MSYTADEIASAFLENYFTAQIKDPRLLADFYSHDSNFSWLHPGRPDQPLACGQQAILEKILSLQLEGSDVGVEQINAQSSGEATETTARTHAGRPPCFTLFSFQKRYTALSTCVAFIDHPRE